MLRPYNSFITSGVQVCNRDRQRVSGIVGLGDFLQLQKHADHVPVITPEPSPIEKSLAALQAPIAELKAQCASGENALSAIQKDFENVGNVIKARIHPSAFSRKIARQSLETTLRSLLEEMLPQALGQAVAPIQADLETLKGELRAKSLTTPTRTEKIETVQRSLPATVARQKIEQQSMSQFDLLARQTVGGLQ